MRTLAILFFGCLTLIVGCKGQPCKDTPPPPSWATLSPDILMPGAHVCRGDDHSMVSEVPGDSAENVVAVMKHLDGKGWTRTKQVVTDPKSGIFNYKKGELWLLVSVSKTMDVRGVTTVVYSRN